MPGSRLRPVARHPLSRIVGLALAPLGLLGCGAGAVFTRIDHHLLEQEPKVSDPQIGKSHSFPAAMKITVSANPPEGLLRYIGLKAHDALFASPDYPEFVFKVMFSSAHTTLCGSSAYAQPGSIWFNVFFGYYEIDVPAATWKRPFGYQRDSNDSPVAVEDIVRIGKADWNYFSNHMYGVPLSEVSRYDAIDMSQVRSADLGREKIGRDYWDHITLGDVTVVSGARSKADTLDFQSVPDDLTAAWHYAFGTASRSAAIPASFPGQAMSGEFFMSFRRQVDAESQVDVYRTYIFGGTLNQGFPDAVENARFLALQLDSLKRIIPNERCTGFPRDRALTTPTSERPR